MPKIEIQYDELLRGKNFGSRINTDEFVSSLGSKSLINLMKVLYFCDKIIKLENKTLKNLIYFLVF
ncbi:hypothetical protein CQA38_04515 [Campylobacter sp. MIT 12-5580]|uniref:hypothetical protein n=1 Tax=Campylobacter sp. MIT 12-5580 TaxID=2040651 RepID=UPI0010F61396|nr:hypothetical protein [Campylobacter sp. MIT 12-5580]TKX29351.1 hypothetical protein CQA38_04515 [Campylobacter sp. MIT 12-5580]